MGNGADITAQWTDGKIKQALFMQNLEGIRIALSSLMPR